MRKRLNIIYNSKFKCILLLSILLSIYIYISASGYVNAVSSDIASSVFRLHVIANSDTQEDQNLKYKVRDKLLEYMNTLSKDAHSKEEVIAIANEHADTFNTIARQTILDNGFNYNVTVKIGNFYFPTKTYGDISLPAGDYDALRIEIGEAKGKNWWCVMFPPLCFVDVSTGIVPDESKDIIKSNLSSEEYSLISEGNNDDSKQEGVKFKFKLIELFKNNDILTAKN